MNTKIKIWVGVIILVSVVIGWAIHEEIKNLNEPELRMIERANGKSLVTILLSEATENGGKFPPSYEALEKVITDRKLLYEKDGVTPKWIYHPNLTTADIDKVILERVAQGGHIKVYVGGNSEFVKNRNQ